MIGYLSRLWRFFSLKRKLQIYFLILLMMAASLLEVGAIGSIMPFLAALADPDMLLSHSLAGKLLKWAGANNKNDVLFLTCLIFCISVIVLAGIRLLLLFLSQRIGHDFGADLSSKIFEHSLVQPYLSHTELKNSDVLAGITVKAHTLVGGAVMPVLNLMSAFFTLLLVGFFLVYLEPYMAALCFIVLSIAYGFTSFITAKKIFELGTVTNTRTNEIIKVVQESFGGIRDITLNRNYQAFCKLYEKTDRELRAAFANVQIISGFPRYFIEVVALVTIALLAYDRVLRDSDFISFIPTLGALAIGGQRLLPMVQSIYSNWAIMISSKASLHDVLSFLEKPIPKYLQKNASSNMKFSTYIELENVSFSYTDKSVPVISNISLKIPKGSVTAFVGKTGCGKSTVLDLIMGLIEADSGSIKVDGKRVTQNMIGRWQNLIAHVPQKVFIKEGSVIDNVTFGTTSHQIDVKHIANILEISCLQNDVQTWRCGLNTLIGEKGQNISGGQIQRIGIARALYKGPKILVLDEGTNALDRETERQVLNNISRTFPNLTILFVTHRISDKRYFDTIVEFQSGQIKSVTSVD